MHSTDQFASAIVKTNAVLATELSVALAYVSNNCSRHLCQHTLHCSLSTLMITHLLSDTLLMMGTCIFMQAVFVVRM